ncbi:hypothetical protein GCM10027430_03960 [Lysobacter tyrosinilyticus]
MSLVRDPGCSVRPERRREAPKSKDNPEATGPSTPRLRRYASFDSSDYAAYASFDFGGYAAYASFDFGGYAAYAQDER